MPAWVNVSLSDGKIFGTPGTNDTGNVQFTLVATNSAGSDTQSIYIRVTPPPPAIDSSLTANATVGTTFTYTIHATGTGTLTYNAYPSANGLSFDGTNKITGNPTATETVSFNISAQDSFVQSDFKTLFITISAAGWTPTASIAATTPNASESTPTNGVFTVTLSTAQPSATTVNFTVGGTAAAGVDYTSIGVSVQIPANQTSATVTVAPIQDANYKTSTTVIATLASGTGYTIGTRSSGTVTISDTAPSGTPPAFVSPNSKILTVGINVSFTLVTTGTPTPNITYAGNLPYGISMFLPSDLHQRTFGGTPAATPQSSPEHP